MKQTMNFNKKRTIACLLSIALMFGVFMTTAISVAADDYRLVWSDEFDGNGVNPYNWTLDQGVRNGERQTYTIDNAKTQNGKLIIKGECTVVDANGNVMPDGQVSNYTKDVRSASLESNGKQAFKFGKVEIRAKLPNACSAWPAFWTCGYDKYGMDAGQGGSNWPCNGEIDFMEMMCVNSNNEPRSPWGKTNTDKEYGVHLHTGPKFIKDTGEFYDGYLEGTRGYYDFAIDPGNVSNGSKQLAADWHTYGMIWEKDSIKITFDGAVKITIDTSNAALLKRAADRVGTNSNEYKAYKTMIEQYGNPFNDYEHYFLLNLAIGGAGTEYRFYNDEWPQNLAIDYIRVYQKNDGSTHNATIKAGTKYTVNGKTYTTYNHRAGKGLTINSAIPSNWVADPKYGGQKVTESDTIPTDTPAASTSSSGSTATTAATTTQKATSGVTINFDSVTVGTSNLEKVGTIAANIASADTTSINSGKSFKTYAGSSASVSDFNTSYAAINISSHIAENANSLSFKSLAVHDNTGSTALAQYGLTIDGKNYWSGTDTNGVINSTVQTISVVGKTLYATDGTSKTITASDIPKITKFLVKPTTTLSKIYVDDITIGVAGSSTTAATTAATAPTTSSGGSTSSSKVIDWDVNTNYYAEGSTLTKGTDSITAVKASGTNLITSTNNNLTAYSGIKFTATPNSGNEKNTVLLKVNDVPWRFTLGSGATECSVTFAEMGVTPTTASKVYFGAEGGTATNITFGDVYGITSGSSTTTTTPATTATTAPTAPTTSSGGSTSSSKIIDWDVNTNYYAVSGNSTIISKDNNGIKLNVIKAGRILGSYNNNTTGYTGITFTAKGNGSLRAVVAGVEPKYTTVSESGTTFTLDFAKLGVIPSSTTEINFDAEGPCEITISDIKGYTGSGVTATPTTKAPTTATPTTKAPTTAAPTIIAPTTIAPTTAALTTVITPVVYGDANGDGIVNLLDLVTMRKQLAKWNVSIDKQATDCNADGVINLLDLILMRKYLAKWNVVLGPQI